MQVNAFMSWSREWLVALFLLILVILYLRGSFQKKVKYRLKNVPSINEPHFLLAMMGVSASFIANGHPTDVWFDINAIYKARLESIKTAQRTIHFETFYMTPGRRANEFADALAERAQAGVEVQLLADSFGTYSIPKGYWIQLKNSGVNVRFFHQFNWRNPLTYNTRTHRKLLLIDGEIALVGGMCSRCTKAHLDCQSLLSTRCSIPQCTPKSKKKRS